MPKPKRFITCPGCQREGVPHKSQGLCGACYQRQKPKLAVPRVRQQAVCTRCGELRPYKGRGLCTRCHQQDQTKPIAPCTACNETKTIKARGLCEACYERAHRKRPHGACSNCGKAGVLRSGRCFTCWYRPRAEKKQQQRRDRYAADPAFRFVLLQYAAAYRGYLRGKPTHTLKEWLARLEEYGYRCAYCLEPATALTRDHMTPVSWPEATDAIEDIVPACASCNPAKNNRNILLFLLSRRPD